LRQLHGIGLQTFVNQSDFSAEPAGKTQCFRIAHGGRQCPFGNIDTGGDRGWNGTEQRQRDGAGAGAEIEDAAFTLRSAVSLTRGSIASTRVSVSGRGSSVSGDKQ
jgi:hypothetical protein